MNLETFIARVDARIEAAVLRVEFEPDQRELLRATVTRYRAISRGCPIFDPLSRGILHSILQAWGRRIDEQVEQLATFCSLYLLSADLIDDVQDADLANKPHEEVGPAVAVNDGVTLLFLALEALQRVIELETNESRRLDFLRVFNRASLAAVAGQHRDLTADQRSVSPEQALAVNQAKTSSLAMITECAAMLARLDDDKCTRYRRIGECLASLIQIRDDLRDVYGTSSSPDLLLGRATYPVACFTRRAEPEDQVRLRALIEKLPASMPAIRALLHEHGAIDDCAEAMEGFREEIHEHIASMQNGHAANRSFLWIVDGLAESVYALPEIPATRPILEPAGAWHDLVRREFELIWIRVNAGREFERPSLRPWHLPQWMYVPKLHRIYYPDIEGLEEETLPFQARLLGTQDLREVADLMRAQVPAVLTHELCHCMRHLTGNLSEDHWHEEWVANRLTVAYLQHFAPHQLEDSIRLAERILARYPDAMDARLEATLARCSERRSKAAGYEMDMTSMAIVSLEMWRRLAMQPVDWDAAVASLLGVRRGCSTSTVAA